MRYLIFWVSEANRNFRNKLFDSVEAQFRNGILILSKHNLTSAIKITRHIFAILDRKGVSNLLRKADIHQ